MIWVCAVGRSIFAERPVPRSIASRFTPEARAGDLVEPLADQQGAFGDEDALFALGQPVGLDPFAQGRAAAGGDVGRPAGQQPARDRHIEDAEHQQGQPKRREA